MGSSEVLVYISAACACMVMVLMMIWKTSIQNLDLPPSPPGRWPIIGHLRILQRPLHRCLHKLSQKYGPLFYIKLGSISTLVVSSPHWAEQFLHAHDREFADRPQLEVGKRLLYNGKSSILMNYGPPWRHLRKIYTTHILTMKRIEMFEKARQEEMGVLIKLVRSQASLEGATVDIRKLVFSTLGNMFTKMLFSKRSFDPMEALAGAGRGTSFKQILDEFSDLFSTPVFGDVIPWLSWLDIGIKRRMDTVAKEMDAFFEDVLVQRIERKADAVKGEDALDYLDFLLNLYITEDGRIDKESIKSILQDLLGGGTESTTAAVEWAMAELLRNPSCLKRLQEEVDTLVVEGEEDTICLKDADVAKLSYLEAVIKETLRLHPPAAIMLRELCDSLDQGIQVEGYRLPKKTRVLVNLWALGRDPMVWGPNAETFFPERFLTNSTLDVRGQHFELLPFGTGRRGCPGINIAMTVVRSILANLVQVVNWRIPNGVPLDLSEACAFTTPMAKNLVAIPSLRVLG